MKKIDTDEYINIYKMSVFVSCFNFFLQYEETDGVFEDAQYLMKTLVKVKNWQTEIGC